MAYKQNSAVSGSVNSTQQGGKEVVKPAQISNIGMLNNQLGTFQANNPEEIALMNQNLSKNHEIRVKKIYHINKPTAEPIFKPPAIKEESKSGSASGSGSEYDSDYSSNYGSYDSDYSDSRSSGSYYRRRGDEEDDDDLPPINHHCDICERNARRKALQDLHESHSRMSNHHHNHQHMHPPVMHHPPPFFHPPFPFHHPLPPLHPHAHALSAHSMQHLPLPPPSQSQQNKNNSFYQGPPPPIRQDTPPEFQTINNTNTAPPQQQRRFNWGDVSKQNSSYLYGSYLRRSDVDVYGSISRRDKPNASYKDLFHQRNNLVDYTYQQFHPKNNQNRKPKQKQKLLKIFKEHP